MLLKRLDTSQAVDQALTKLTRVPVKREARAILGENVRRRRSELGFTQEAFAHFAGLHRVYYGRIERGQQNVSIERLAWLAGRLQTSVPELTEGLTREVCAELVEDDVDLNG
jgi:transcriptional regulator with XRE-family HTH domain